MSRHLIDQFLLRQARTVKGKTIFPCSADLKQDWQPYPVLLNKMTTHHYRHGVLLFVLFVPVAQK